MPSSSIRVYAPRCIGAPNTPEYRVFISYNGHVLSALHDVPLLTSPPASNNVGECILNMVVEAPRWSNAQMELALGEPLAPIRQAVHGRRLAYVRNCFPHQGHMWNYGVLPQTWSEGAPLHVCEIGEVARVGEVCSVRVLGVLAPCDEGKLRYTLLAINTADPLAARIHSLADLERECPGLMTATREWFRLYKLPDGKAENTFEWNAQVRTAESAEEIVRTAHAAWRDLVTASAPNPLEVDLSNVTIGTSPGFFRGSALAAVQVDVTPPAPVPPSVDKSWHIAYNF